MLRYSVFVGSYFPSKFSYMRFFFLPFFLFGCRAVSIGTRPYWSPSTFRSVITLSTLDNGELSVVLISQCCSIHTLSPPWVQWHIWTEEVTIVVQKSTCMQPSIRAKLKWRSLTLIKPKMPLYSHEGVLLLSSFVTLLHIFHSSKAIRSAWENGR